MDGGPLRSQRPAARPTSRQPEPTYHRSEEVLAASMPEEREVISREHTTRTYAPDGQPKKSRKRLSLIIGSTVLVILIAVGGWFAVQRMTGAPGIDSSRYQAVFFTNGLVYYGKLTAVNAQYLKLTNVYYIQSQSNDGKTQSDSQTSSDTGQSKLIKMGSEVYGPDDEITIARDQVLYYTNLKSDSKVVQLIQQSHS